MSKLLVLSCVLAIVVATTTNNNHNNEAAGQAATSSSSTAGNDNTVDFGHGVQVLTKMVRQYLNSQPEDFKVSEGVHLVNIHSENDARSNTEDKTVLGAVENYLKTHELRIRLPELMPGEGFGRAFKDVLSGLEANEAGSPRGKGGLGGGKGGGLGGVMLLGLMMGKMMAALGIGGVGLLAMKALMVSALALMLSVIIGLKKLVHSGGDEGGHTVIHASHGHGHDYRRKREAADIAYRAWSAYNSS